MGRGLASAFVILIIDCGGGVQTFPTDASTDASSDVGSGFDAMWPVDGGGTSDAEIDSGPPCVEGDFHLDVTNTSGTTTLTGGCGDAGAPSIAWLDPCLDCWLLQASACGGGESLEISVGAAGQVGTWSPAQVTRIDADGGSCKFDAKLTVYNWPSPGGTVKGEYTAYNTGPCNSSPSLVSGHFCLQRQ